jgi:hypothetical protein
MRLAADENFDGRILSGLRSRLPALDIVRIQDTPLYRASDPDLLDWLAREERILLTHDIRTIPRFVFERVQDARPVPGVIAVQRHAASIGALIDELVLILSTANPGDFRDQVMYVPLR